MYIAIDKSGQRTSIKNANPICDYFCPICGAPLVQKRGNIHAHHFAHKSNASCHDSWHYDKSPWHQRWQQRFPEKYQEVVKEFNGEKHRADILIDDINTVIEFQHSRLSYQEFESRNLFYQSLKYKIIWVFDLTDEFENKYLYSDKSEKTYYWTHPLKTLQNFDCNNPNISLFFQIKLDATENETLQELLEFERESGIDDALGPDSGLYVFEHKNDRIQLVKVTESSDNFQVFHVKQIDYYLNDFMEPFYPVWNQKRKFERQECSEKLKYIGSKDHSKYYLGCPKSTTHKCVNSIVDVPESKYNEIMPCKLCESTGFDPYNPRCYYKYDYVNSLLSENDAITNIKRDSNGLIKAITASVNNEAKTFSFDTSYIPTPTNTNKVDTIPNFWEKLQPKVAIFFNTRTGYYVKINNDPFEQVRKYRKCYGCLSKERYKYQYPSKEIYDFDKKIWKFVWCPYE